MSESIPNRVVRRRTAMRGARATSVAAAAAAMALGVAAPPANAIIAADITVDPAYTAGSLAALINFIPKVAPGLSLADGLFDSGPPPSINVAVQTVLSGFQVFVDATLNLRYVSPSDPAALYNTLGAIPNPTGTCTYANNCRYAVMLGTSEATLNLANAYRTQIESVTNGKTPAGYIPFQPSPQATAAKPTRTDQVLAFLQNSLRPNGGLAARFPDISQALGINPTMPAGGKYLSGDSRTVVNTTTIDATWAYDPIGDFPEVFNLTALTNSALALLPLNLVGGLQGYVITDETGKIVTETDIALNIAGVLNVGVSGTPLGTVNLGPADGKSYYATLVPNQLPILAPLRLPGLGINAVLGALNSPYLLGNPFADAIEPALKILVNIAYDDVVVTRDPDTGVATYTRTFTKSAIPTPFGSVDPLTEEERAAVPGDVWNALLGGIQAQLDKPFWGILVPANPPQVTPPAAVKSAAPAASAASVAPQVNSVAVQQSPVTPVVSTPEIEAQAATAESAPAATDVADLDEAALGAALAEEAAAQTPVSAARTTRAGDADQRRGASSADSDGSSRPPVSAGRGRAAG